MKHTAIEIFGAQENAYRRLGGIGRLIAIVDEIGDVKALTREPGIAEILVGILSGSPKSFLVPDYKNIEPMSAEDNAKLRELLEESRNQWSNVPIGSPEGGHRFTGW